ncbi:MULTISPECIES: acetate kinase [unclassified Pseudactinotalea]|uniref:acetate kinase n=1 Tax=unclassified Pseudactinotalea TaxID=2649176 RepID=UPI003C7CC4C0
MVNDDGRDGGANPGADARDGGAPPGRATTSDDGATAAGSARGSSGVVLVINSGSSSLKYQVVDTGAEQALATGLIERIGQPLGICTHSNGGRAQRTEQPVPDHEAAMALMRSAFDQHGPDLDDSDLAAVGHRVVQGGARFGGPVLIDDEAIEIIESLVDLAPLHNPANLQGIRAAREYFPQMKHVAVFDTAFHLTMPDYAATYAIDQAVAAEHRIHRYGAHGTSHQYVSREAARFLGMGPEEANLIVLHLGNGASATAVRQGRSVDTSMGLTPLEGLVMGTRSGDIDPAVVFHLARTAGMGINEIDELLNRRSGMLGLSGHADMRDVDAAITAGDADARLARQIYTYRIRKYVGAYTAALGHVHAIVFTAGIGENDTAVRAESLAGLERMGIEVDPQRNTAPVRGTRVISTDDSAVAVLVVPTNEELEIAGQALSVVSD